MLKYGSVLTFIVGFRRPDQVFLFAPKISSLEDLTSEEMKSKQGLSPHPSAWPVATSTFYRHEEKEYFNLQDF